jgi:plastocyanin
MGWLTNSGTGAVLRVGRLLPGDNNSLTASFNAPGDANLLGQYDGFQVTAEELETDPQTPSTDVLLSGRLPADAVTHIGHILVSDPDLPNAESVMDGLLGQLDVVRQHVGFMQDSLAQGNFANVRLHAEHLINIIEGAKGEHYGDLNKDGKTQNPGDGVGLLPGSDQLGYLQHTRDHADKAAAVAGASDNIKVHAGHVDICVENVRGWVSTIRDRSLQILAAKNLNETRPFVDEIAALSNRAINGQPVGDEGQVQPVPGSGGAITAYQHSQLMAGIPISSEGATGVQGSGGSGSASAPNPTPTTAAAEQNPAAGQTAGTKVDISNSNFGQPLTVKAGTTVVWTNLDSIQHSVTADDNSFDSGTLNKGGTFSQTFSKAGTFPYYCIFHGGPGGQGMASIITVEP